jgi:seryl-tRNA synthetase
MKKQISKKILELDEQKRKVQFEFDTLKSTQNRVSKEIGMKKRNKEDATELLNEMKTIAGQVKDLASTLNEISATLEDELLRVPNIPNQDVPVGKTEDDNVVVDTWGEKPSYDFEPKDQAALIDEKNLIDLRRGAKLTGSGFLFYHNKGALLERALMNFMIDFHVKNHDYTEVAVPYIVNRNTMTGTGQLPKLADDMYHITEEDFYLIPTAEVPVTNYFSNEILPNKMIPQKFVAMSPCFRREAGSYGKDTKGIQRIHQFNKVEMVRFVKPEESYQHLEDMIQNAEAILKALGLHYRKLQLCTGDTSFASAKTIDLEVWAPGTGKYLEVSSISNFEDFQARRAKIRYRDDEGKAQYVHTLNGSGLATPRTYIALIETYQNEDGTITIPECLRPYMHGLEKI